MVVTCLLLRVNRAGMEGTENLPDTLMMLFRGENFGKLVLKVSKD